MKDKKIRLNENQMKLLLMINEEKITLNEDFNLSDFVKKSKKNASKLKNPASFAAIVKKIWQDADPKIKPLLGQLMLQFEDSLNLQDFLQVLKRVGPILTKADQRKEEEKKESDDKENEKSTEDKEKQNSSNIKIPSI